MNHTNSSGSSIESVVHDGAAKAKTAVQQIRSGFSETADAAMDAVKSEMGQISRTSRDVASMVGAEVVKRPLTYTLAAAGAGALVGVGIMALLNRPRNSVH